MNDFATLINAIDSTNKTSLKQEAIIEFLQVASSQDKLWFLSLFTGRKPKRNVNSTLMKMWAMEVADIPEWLFVESYSSVGDLGETISLILPPPTKTIDYSLSEWMQKIIELKDKTEDQKKEFVLDAWSGLDYVERFIFNKLLGGSFRIGVSSKTLINTLAKYYNLYPNAVTHSIMGIWTTEEVDFEKLIKGDYTATHLSKPYPFCLAYALEKEIEDLGETQDWLVEYKWDGIRGQFIKREGEVFIWSRGEELVTDQFPEIRDELFQWKGNFVLDGEILAFKNEQVLNFTELQKRLNRKNLTKKILDEIPIVVYAYDVLECDQDDYREKSMMQRRLKLEQILEENPSDKVHLSEKIIFENWNQLPAIRENAREINSEGLMLKNVHSHYHTGRKKGDWWKWKLDPLTIDAVLIYAQKGSGRRSGYYTDYTFAVKKEGKLVTIAKAYSGLTDKEIQEVSKFISKNVLERFGPVRTVKPELVFELAFEGIGFSSRHKSGVALRFPRILRWRRDKKVEDIDDIEDIKKLIT
ncbi:ATP-dependent DNA ligase [Empedobacter brevis]|uniref:ATP-dependent DNA ligase n=1 Tax=Empedobacter brevis TaxID=247 RepID=UPI00123E21C5|nr:ATP-dependent DNA ligase [Empedobacter brevis]QES93939.1 ATP-dependent DNA ligase [Empedobacter brevis]